jgi:uncharacterized protein YegJ (DUF2314 family)
METDGPDKIVKVNSEVAEMLSAIDQARKSLRQFLEAFFAPKPNQKHFLVKVCFEEQDEREHIWLADLDLSSSPPTGVVANEPKIRNIAFMQRVPIDFGLLSDWMYYEDDCLVGGFTTKVLRPSARPN